MTAKYVCDNGHHYMSVHRNFNEGLSDIGLVGLAVMGQNLVLNMADHGYRVCVYNRTQSKVTEFLEGLSKTNPALRDRISGAEGLADLCGKLQRPRRVMLMVKAGEAVDQFIELLLPHLQPGDLIIDGGNSQFNDTERRCKYLATLGLLYLGTGVSGGEEGARYGPSIMPGGSPGAWPLVKDLFQAISAKAEEDGEACCEWVGEGGSGHYVKMVHNGIEYGDMQLIAEAYHLMRDGLAMTNTEMTAAFAEWTKSPELGSFLVEITREILAYKDEQAGGGPPLVERIRDAAGQKGTGKWTVEASLNHGIPVTLIAEAVFARSLSALKDERVVASRMIKGPSTSFTGNKHEMALYASKIISYAQGFMLFRQAAKDYGWGLNYGGIAKMWRGGCIIRSGTLLSKITAAFAANPTLPSLLLDPFFRGALEEAQASWRRVIAEAVLLGIPVPALSSALAFFDGYRCARLPANMIQAQRDYFGAHTFEYEDTPGTWHHVNWTGRGGDVSSTVYNA